MPIEFRCRKCLKRLRVPDEAVGKGAKCPECGLVQEIPAIEPPPDLPSDEIDHVVPETPAPAPQSPSPPPERSPAPASPFGAPIDQAAPDESDNPYQSPPSALGGPASYGPVAARQEVVPTRIVFGDIFEHTWELFKINLGPVLVATLLLQFMVFPMWFVFMMLTMAVGAAQPAGNELLVMLVGLPVLMLLGFLAFAWLIPGYLKILLQCGRCEKVDWMNLLRGGRYLFRYLGAMCLFSVAMLGLGMVWMMILVGMFALIDQFAPAANFLAPLMGIGGYILFLFGATYLGISFGWFHFLIVDQDYGVLESFRESQRIMQGNKTTVFLAVLVTQLLGGILNMCTCGLGGLLLAPYFGILFVTIYLMASGQPLGTLPAYSHSPTSPPGPSSRDASPFATTE